MKQTTKRLLAFILALSLCFSLLSAHVQAAEEGAEASVQAAAELSAPEAEESAPETEPEESKAEESAAEAEPEASKAEESEPEASKAEESEPEEESAPEASESEQASSAPATDETSQPAAEEAPEAAEASEEESVTEQADPHQHNSLTFTAWDKANSLPTGAGSYCLSKDVTLSGNWNVPSGVTNLCLNGHKIQFTGTNGGHIYVGEGCTLNLYDCGTVSHSYSVGDNGLAVVGSGDKSFTGGCITGGHSTYGGAVAVYGGTFHMYGGTLIGSLADSNGGGVYVCRAGQFLLSGGNLLGNSAYPHSGGGVCLVGGSSFTMSGGSICDNTAPDGNGAGVVVSGSSSFELSAGTISRNSARGGGIGVYVTSGSQFSFSGGTISDNTGGVISEGGGVAVLNATGTMTGGTITNCKTGYGGGIKVSHKGVFQMKGGSVTNNIATSYGGGVYNGVSGTFEMTGGTISDNAVQGSVRAFGGGISSAGALRLSGAPVFSGNEKVVNQTRTADNITLYNTSRISLIGPLTNTAPIGVSMQDVDWFQSEGVFTTGSTEQLKASDYIDRFSSDVPEYEVMTEGNELKLENPHPRSWSGWSVTTRATCSAKGEERRTCSGCEAFESRELDIDPNYHTWGAWKVTKRATCSAKGEEEHICSGCLLSEKRETDIDPDNHSWSTWRVTKRPTCSAKGEEQRVCGSCGALEKRETDIVPDNHNWSEWTVTKRPTCSAKGEEQRVCGSCGALEKREIDIDSDYHSQVVVKNKKEANAAEKGNTGDICCKDCGKVFIHGEEIPVLKFDYIDLNKTEKKQADAIVKALGVNKNVAAQMVKAAQALGVDQNIVKTNERTLKLKNLDEKELKGSSYGILQARAVKRNKSSLKLKWNNMELADGYSVFGAPCGKKNKMKFIKRIRKDKDKKTLTWTHKKLKKGTYYKYLVIAYRNIRGARMPIAASVTVHAPTSGGQFTDARSVSVKQGKKAVTELSLKKKKSVKLKAKEVKREKDKVLPSHRKIKYESSNPAVATVSKTGKITAKKKGEATIYVYAQNGAFEPIKVTVTAK